MAAEALNDTEARAPTFYLVDEAEEPHHAPGSSTLLGFWIYLMSDALIFATLFATYGVLSTAYAGGPTPRDIFELPLVALNTAILLVSSDTDELIGLSDRIIVLRDQQAVAEFPQHPADKQSVLAAIVGRSAEGRSALQETPR